ncbi:MAG: helix-turn-helix domain-containing protein [Roseburia faecis]
MSKFLSYEDRMIIAQRLQENASFGAIGTELGKDRTTIAKEIKKYSYDKKSGRPGYPYNPCKFRATCKAKGFAEQAVHTNPLTNAACALNAPYIVLTL